MSKTFISHRVHYGEIEKVDLICSFLEKVKNTLNSDEDSEFIIICDLEESQIRFHLARLLEEEIVNPQSPYQVNTKDLIILNCAKDILDEAGNWTHISPK